MTDKQIIIDVSQCPHYKRGNVCTFLSYETKCEGECSWVTYKEMEEKLKRKEQECERLKEEVSLLKESNSKLQPIEDVVSLEKWYLQQLDQLKDQLEAYKMEAEEGKEINAELKAENEDLKEIIQRHDNDNNALLSEFEDDLVEYYRRYKECLPEIKEIAEESYRTPLAEKDCIKCDEFLEQILQKISECEV